MYSHGLYVLSVRRAVYIHMGTVSQPSIIVGVDNLDKLQMFTS